MADAGQVIAAIKAFRYAYADEIALQEGIAAALALAGIEADREVRLSRRDKVDFLVGTIGIELKVAGQPAAVERQLGRYAASERISELVLVTTRPAHRSVPRLIGGKPMHVAWLSGVAR